VALRLLVVEKDLDPGLRAQILPVAQESIEAEAPRTLGQQIR
jgi:hypothetical protein